MFNELLAAFGRFADALGERLNVFGLKFQEFCAAYCYKPLNAIFDPINRVLNPIYQPWATIVAVGFFVGTMLWVCFILPERYVNLGRPVKRWWADLRLWTVFSMLPHVFVYFYFY